MPRISTTLATLALILAPAAAQAQAMAVRVLASRQVPAGVAFAGRVEAARQWTDRTGENLLLLTRTPEVPTPDGSNDDARDRELHAYHYVRQGAGWRLLWQTRDFVRDCPWDVVLSFVPGSLQVSDADRDGVAETAFVYRLACRSDVSPGDVKLIMHQGATKYAIRGTGDMRYLGSGYPAPQMRIDPALAANPALRAAAVRLWNRCVREPAEEETGAP